MTPLESTAMDGHPDHPLFQVNRIKPDQVWPKI
jgi:hypothetical protein